MADYDDTRAGSSDFFQQFEREVQGAERYEIGEEQLLFFIGEDVIAYQHQDRVIRRQLNQEGHLVMCQYVKQFSVSEESPTLFKVNLTLQMGTETLSTERWLALRAGSRGVREDH